MDVSIYMFINAPNLAGNLDNLFTKQTSCDTESKNAIIIDDGHPAKNSIPTGLPPLKLHVNTQTYNLVQTIIQKLRGVSDASDER